jgi:hypothetical protein
VRQAAATSLAPGQLPRRPTRPLRARAGPQDVVGGGSALPGPDTYSPTGLPYTPEGANRASAGTSPGSGPARGGPKLWELRNARVQQQQQQRQAAAAAAVAATTTPSGSTQPASTPATAPIGATAARPWTPRPARPARPRDGPTGRRRTGREQQRPTRTGDGEREDGDRSGGGGGGSLDPDVSKEVLLLSADEQQALLAQVDWDYLVRSETHPTALPRHQGPYQQYTTNWARILPPATAAATAASVEDSPTPSSLGGTLRLAAGCVCTAPTDWHVVLARPQCLSSHGRR